MRVPTYEGSVATRPIHQQGVEGRAIEGAFGGGQGMMALADGVGKLGKALAEVRDLEDMTRAKDAENEFALYMQGAMYGEGGYMLSEGRNAFEGRKGFMDGAEKKRREIAARLKGGAARLFNEASTMRMLDVNGQVLQHAAAGQKAWVKEASLARQELFGQDAWNNVGNQAAVNKSIAAGLAEIRAQAQLEGISGEALVLKERAYVSGVQAGVVVKLSAHDPIAAADYLASVGNQIDPATRFDLEEKLKEPVLVAKSNRNADLIVQGLSVGGAGGQDFKSHGGGVTSRPLGEIKLNSDGSAHYLEVAGQFVGMHEVRDNVALSEFIKRAGGVNIDPKVTPWCAAFVNAVLGAGGIEGTGKLNARSFLNFGQETKQPKIGDIVVLSRGDPNGAQGHVGFFQGYDDKGNVLVLGGNQGDSVSVAPYKADKVLGFRSAGRVDGATSGLPNYQIGSLAAIEGELAKIADPREREATRAELERRMTLQKKRMDQARDEVIDYIDRQLIGYPQMDLNSLPLEMQEMMGAKEMQALRNTQKARLTDEGVQTNDALYVNLVKMRYDDPVGFANMNPLAFRDQLSDSDWKQVMGWWGEARKGGNGGGGGSGGSDKIGFSMAQSVARAQLDGVGINAKYGRKKAKQEAQFYRALSEQLMEFFTLKGRAANEGEAMEIINRLLLPVVIKEKGSGWFSDNRDGYVFEASERGIKDSVKMRDAAAYDQIPISEALKVYQDLVAEGIDKPTEQEVTARWFEWKTGIAAGEDEEGAGEEDEALWKNLATGT